MAGTIEFIEITNSSLGTIDGAGDTVVIAEYNPPTPDIYPPYIAENIANKRCNLVDPNNITYPTTLAVVNGLTGTTAVILSIFDYFTGTTLPNNYYNKIEINNYTGTTLPNNYYNKIEINNYTGITAPLMFASKANAITGATNIGSGTTIYTNTINNKLNLKTFGVRGGLSITGDSENITIIGGGGTITGATNGLTVFGKKIGLGGILTSGTSLCAIDGSNLTFIDNRTTPIGIQYGNDYSLNITSRSIPDASYVTGKTKNITAVGEINQIIYRDSSKLTGCTNMIYCDANKSFSFGRSNIASGNDTITLGGTNNVTTGVCSAIIGGQNNCINSTALRAAIVGGQNITLSSSTYNDTVAIDCLAIMCTPSTCVGEILTYQPITGKITKSTLSYLGGLTGATNGIHLEGQNIALGGNLTECTTIKGGYCFDIDAVRGFNIRTSGNTDINIDAQQCGGFLIKSQCGIIDAFPDFTNAVGFFGHITEPSGFAIYDNRTGSTQTGIVYANDYSPNYVDRSLVDKRYVDTVATGLQVHTATWVTTTGNNINLTSAPLSIDGVILTNGKRVLVKDQSIGSENGIYVFNGSGSSMTRATDYNFSPSGEIFNGDLIPVTSGNTENNTIWVLTTQNPIVSGDTLTFTRFATIIDIQGGQGIAISQIGGVHTACVDLATLCGLTFCGNGLAVNPNIAGNGLSYLNGIININVSNCTTVPSIPVGYNAGDCLVVACADIINCVNAISGATNGITETNKKICLGGTLINDTTINGNNTYDLNLTCLIDFNLGFCNAIITDSCGSPRGLQYAGDYGSSFLDRSLVDKYWTNNRITGGTTILTANNGLTKSGTNVHLGGSLTGTTTINGPQTLRINTCYINLTGTTGLNISTGNGLITDTGNKGGLQYAADYSGSIVARSIPDAAYVTGKTNCIATNYLCSANNGLTKSGTNVHLGGSLTGTTTINGAQTLNFNNNIFNLTGATSINLTTPILTLQTTPPTGVSSDDVLVWNTSDKCVKIINGSAFGLVTGATNGLNLTNKKIGLGGTLTGNTTINLNSYCLNICGGKLCTSCVYSPLISGNTICALTSVKSSLISGTTVCGLTSIKSSLISGTTVCALTSVKSSLISGITVCGLTSIKSSLISGSTVCGDIICGTSCLSSPIVKGTTCTCGNIVCGGTRVTSPIVCSTSCFVGNNLTGLEDRIAYATSGGTIEATLTTVFGKISDPTAITLLTTDANWDINGQFLCGPVANTYEGQYLADTNYMFFMYSDGAPIRLIRG